MGGGSSKPENTDGKSTTIDLQLIDQQLDDLFKFKILLLGAGESGKSTVVKQLKLIHKKNVSRAVGTHNGNLFAVQHKPLHVSDKELKLVAMSLHQNVVDCIRSLMVAARNFGFAEWDAESLKTEQMLLVHDESERVSPELGVRIANLFHTDQIQKTFARKSEFWLLDSFPYYVKNLERFCSPDFKPTEEDSVMARIRTTGIVNSELEQPLAVRTENEPEGLKFQVVDVGGQRNERKKWMHCFDDVRAILFIVNLAGYNQVLFEDTAKNRMHEELELFEQITQNKLFEYVPIFLFLNKKDLFEHMIREQDLSKTFQNYSGGNDPSVALEFVMEQFRKKLPPGKTVSIHPVSARWTKDIKGAFEDVKKALYDDHKEELLAQAATIKAQRKKAEKGDAGAGGGCGCA